MVRHLRVTGNQSAWRAKLVKDYDIDDRHHKDAMLALIEDIKQLAVVRDYYIDRETISKLYDRHISYQEKIMSIAPQREWVGLTADEQSFVFDQVKQIVDSKPFWVRFADAIEAKLKEKNSA